MRRKYKVDPVNTPEDLRQFEGWEVRKIHMGSRAGIILQNPDTGEKRKLIVSNFCFEGGYIKSSRRLNNA